MKVEHATGVVTRVHPGQEVYDVESDDGGTFQDCTSAVGGVFAPLFGVQSKYRIPVGTKVSFLTCVPAIILHTLPSQAGDPGSALSGPATTGDLRVTDIEPDDSTSSAIGARPRADVVDGEFLLENVFQVGIHILTHLASLGAGGRARVECHLVDDLVRMISHTFEHFTSFGELRVVNDGGRITLRQNGTSHEHETWGLVDENAPKAAGKKDGMPQMKEEAETARWRFSQFLGYMGDFMHVFVTDPVKTLGMLAQSRAGKFHAHVNVDGSLVVQSVADIVLERVTRIVVPEEQFTESDARGNTADEAPSSEFLDTWPVDADKPWECALRIREYSRWLASYHAYARFLQQNKDWKVPAESEVPDPDYAAGEKSREQAVPQKQRVPRTTYSCMRILRDGSQVMLNGYGCAVTMIGKNVSVSAVQDLSLQAGRNISLQAGHNVFVKARKNIELVAVLGTALLKARARVAVWAEQGTVLLRSLMQPAEKGEPPAHRFNKKEVGVLIDAPHADVVMSSGRRAVVESRAEDLEEPALVLQSVQDMTLRTGSDGVMRAIGGGGLVVKASKLLLQAEQWISLVAQDLDFGGLLAKRKGKLIARTLTAAALLAKTIASGTRLPGGREQHVNHVGLAPDLNTDFGDTPDSDELKPHSVPPLQSAQAESTRARPVCDYLPKSAYPAQPEDQSLMQQIAEQEEHPADVTFDTWNFEADAANGDENAIHTHPYPGKGAQMRVYRGGDSLHSPTSKPASEFRPVSTQAEEVPAAFKHLPS